MGEYILLDAHVLTTPAIVDVDHDGKLELIVPVSYFFYVDYYDEVLEKIDIDKYIASGLLCYDLYTGKYKWEIHLDLSTSLNEYKAYITSTPTIVDIDRDGVLDIIVGTELGLMYKKYILFSYVFDINGKARDGFPIQVGPIENQIICEDVRGDENLEIVCI